MKVVIFAGGFGTRISEESYLRPKPMIEIGGKPILWHIMKIYSHYGYDDFVICLGYKGQMIKEYFMNYYLYNADVTLDLSNNNMEVLQTKSESFKVTLIDTGLKTMTAGRLKRVAQYLGDETFMLTYGDGVSDVNLNDLLEYHKNSGKIATVTAIQPAGKFGSLEIENDGAVSSFIEKPKGDGYWINGGFFVLEPEVLDYLDDDSDDIMWEDRPLNKLADNKELAAYKHYGFWKCMDAIRDKEDLESLWQSGQAKWKVWE